jgi:hypothetical protein
MRLTQSVHSVQPTLHPDRFLLSSNNAYGKRFKHNKHNTQAAFTIPARNINDNTPIYVSLSTVYIDWCDYCRYYLYVGGEW